MTCHPVASKYSLVDVVSHERDVQEERKPLSGQEEAQGEECVCEHFGEDKLQKMREAISGRIFPFVMTATHGIELVAQVDRVDVVAFEIREHDDLRRASELVESSAEARLKTHEKHHREKQSRGHEDREEKEPCCETRTVNR